MEPVSLLMPVSFSGAVALSSLSLLKHVFTPHFHIKVVYKFGRYFEQLPSMYYSRKREVEQEPLKTQQAGNLKSSTSTDDRGIPATNIFPRRCSPKHAQEPTKPQSREEVGRTGFPASGSGGTGLPARLSSASCLLFSLCQPTTVLNVRVT